MKDVFQKWKARNGQLVVIDSIAFNDRLMAGTINGARCIWDSNSMQSWSRKDWDLVERLDKGDEVEVSKDRSISE